MPYLTITASVQIDNAANAHIDHTKKALVPLLELLLVEDLDGQYALLGDPPTFSSVIAPACCIATCLLLTHMSKLSFQYGLSVFLITPVVFVCSPLIVATAKGSGNPIAGVSEATVTSEVAGRTHERHLACISHPPQ